jgi:hypothetical protein
MVNCIKSVKGCKSKQYNRKITTAKQPGTYETRYYQMHRWDCTDVEEVCCVYRAWCTQGTPECTQQQFADSGGGDTVWKNLTGERNVPQLTILADLMMKKFYASIKSTDIILKIQHYDKINWQKTECHSKVKGHNFIKINATINLMDKILKSNVVINRQTKFWQIQRYDKINGHMLKIQCYDKINGRIFENLTVKIKFMDLILKNSTLL